jgi:hypothetical protein
VLEREEGRVIWGVWKEGVGHLGSLIPNHVHVLVLVRAVGVVDSAHSSRSRSRYTSDSGSGFVYHFATANQAAPHSSSA